MTGGGSMKYASLFTEQLGVSIQRTDEMDSIMAGLVLLASHTNSVFRFDLNTRQRVPVDVVRHTSADASSLCGCWPLYAMHCICCVLPLSLTTFLRHAPPPSVRLCSAA